MNIVCATDNNFVQHCAVTLISILKNNSNDINIYILTEGLSEDNESKLKQLVTKNGGQIHIILVNSDILKDCPMPKMSVLDHISMATYYRLLISKLLPENIDKVIYFDCDIVVRHNLDDLWNYSVTGNALAAVYQISKSNIDEANRLGYPCSYGYFNAGVLLINLKYWRDHHISERLFEFLNLNKEKIIYHDQDVLNGMLYDKCLKLPIKWNMLTYFFMKKILNINDVINGEIINSYADYKNQILNIKGDPSVIHFVYKPKPWDAACDHPYKNIYFQYLRYTPWKEFKAPKVFLTSLNHPQIFYIWFKEKIKRIFIGNPYLPTRTKKIRTQ